MGHGDQVQFAVEDAKQFVALEIQLMHVAQDLLVVRGVAETQVAVVRLQRQQMGSDAFQMPGPHGPDGHGHRGGRVGLAQLTRRHIVERTWWHRTAEHG
ncbi:hypothetical protein D9M69_656480 [compost metagenome]